MVGYYKVWLSAVCCASLIVATGCGETERLVRERDALTDTYLAFRTYTEAHSRLPSDKISTDGERLVSWRFVLSPHLSPPFEVFEVVPDVVWNADHYESWREYRQFAVGRDGGFAVVCTIAAEVPLKSDTALSASDIPEDLALFMYAPELAFNWMEPRDCQLENLSNLSEISQSETVVVCLANGRIVAVDAHMPVEDFEKLFLRSTQADLRTTLLKKWATDL